VPGVEAGAGEASKSASSLPKDDAGLVTVADFPMTLNLKLPLEVLGVMIIVTLGEVSEEESNGDCYLLPYQALVTPRFPTPKPRFGNAGVFSVEARCSTSQVSSSLQSSRTCKSSTSVLAAVVEILF
jgi:hypothetical protein